MPNHNPAMIRIAKRKAAEAMRERAARLAETVFDERPPHAGWDIAGRKIAAAISALPLEEKDGE